MTQTPVAVRVVSRSQGVDAVSSGAGTLTRRGKALRLVYGTAEDAGTVRNTVSAQADGRVTVDRRGLFDLHMTLQAGFVSRVTAGGALFTADTREAAVTDDGTRVLIRLIYTLDGAGTPSDHDLTIEATEETL